jgi:predicted phosphoribosyltransferase
LADALLHYKDRRPVVLAIPNGGVAVAQPVAEALECPLHLILVRKLQIPGNTEAGFGAVSADGTTVVDSRMVKALGLTDEQIEAQSRAAMASIQTRAETYGRASELPDTENRSVIIIDDGLASGATMEAAVRIVRSRPHHRLIAAAPTGSAGAVKRIGDLVDDLVCPDVGSAGRFAVAEAYQLWRDVPDEEVRRALAG